MLGGVAAGVAAPAAASVLPVDGPFGRVAATGQPPAEDWTNKPADSDINGVLAREGVLLASTADGYVSVDQASGDRLWRYPIQERRVAVRPHQGSVYVVDEGSLVALDGTDGKRWTNTYDQVPTIGVNGDTGYLAHGSTLEAVSLSDGSTRWTAEVANLNELQRAIDGAVITSEGGVNTAVVSAHDPANGNQLWRTKLAETVYRTTKYFGTETIYYGYDNTLEALSVADGSTRWSRTFDNGVPLVFGTRGRPILLDDGTVMGLSTTDGSQRWSLSLDGDPFPVGYTENGVLLSAGATLVKVSLDGTRRWSYDLNDTQRFPRVTTVGDLVYLVDGGALYELSGGQAQWSFEESGSLTFVASDDQRVYANDASSVYAWQHGASGGTQTTAAPPETTAAPEETTAPPEETTAASETTADAENTDSDGETAAAPATTAESGGDSGGGDSGGDSNGGGGSPGFGVLTAVAAALLAALRLLGGGDEE